MTAQKWIVMDEYFPTSYVSAVISNNVSTTYLSQVLILSKTFKRDKKTNSCIKYKVIVQWNIVIFIYSFS